MMESSLMSINGSSRWLINYQLLSIIYELATSNHCRPSSVGYTWISAHPCNGVVSIYGTRCLNVRFNSFSHAQDRRIFLVEESWCVEIGSASWSSFSMATWAAGCRGLWIQCGMCMMDIPILIAQEQYQLHMHIYVYIN